MGTKRTASEARQGSRKPFNKTNGAGNGFKGKQDGARGRKPVDGGRTTLVFQPRPDWHAAELSALPVLDQIEKPPSRAILEELHQYADSLLEAENATYASKNMSSDSSHKFLGTIMSSGTLEDKVSALTLLVQESPLHNMKAFDNLLGLARKKSRHQALMSLGALKDLLGAGVVLPPDRKLRTFTKQPGLLSAFSGKNTNWKKGDRLPPGIDDAHLVAWAYEDWLKKTYFELLKVLEGWCNDEIEYSRSRAITYAWELLKEKPEQEENLLRLLINKLGDTGKKIASRASYLLLQLQVSHPVMKSVIIAAIESELLFRPGQSNHARYYAIITLNQTILSTKEPEVASKLLEIYFSIFLTLLKKNPKSEDKKNGPIQGGGGQAGKKAQQKAKAKAKAQEKADLKEVEMNDKIIAQVLAGVNRAFPYAKTDDDTFENQLDTLFRVTHSSNFNTSIQALMLIQQIAAAKHFSADRFYRTLYESLLDPRLLTSSKQIMYLNLLYKSLKADVSIKRVKAFVKRLLQIITLHEPPFVCGVLYLIAELQNTFPSIKTMLTTPEANDDDEEEHFVDAPEDGEADAAAAENAAASKEVAAPTSTALRYDGRKRDPEHTNADLSCMWELLPFPQHFHPSVSLFGSRLLNQETMPPKPDPTLHSLMHFLDRFAYRNAKQKTSAGKGTSIMQPMAGADTADLLIKTRDGSRTEAPLNSEQFWRKRVEDVSVDEVFFHQYFEKSGKKAQADKKKQKDKKVKEAEEESDAEEEEIWNALVGSRPEIEGDFDEDDEELSDLEEALGEDEDEDEDGGVEINMGDAPSEDEDMIGEAESDDGFDAAGLEDDDEGAFVDSDEELPSDFEGFGAAADESEERPSKKKGEEAKGKKRRKLKHLPTFASVEDYAKLLEDDDSS